MHISGLVGALAPVFFVLLLGYLAGKRNQFDADQSAGLSKLALNFALPASLFVSMTAIPKDLLLKQGRLLLALTIAHVGLFIAACLLLNLVKSLHGTASLIYALALSTSATPVFGFAVLEPLLGTTAGPTIGLVSLTINLIVPLAVVLLAMNEAAKHTQVGVGASRLSPVLTGLGAGLSSPLLWAPVLGIILTLSGHHLPTPVAACLDLIGSATSGVAVFAVGLVLAAHPILLSRGVFLGSIARVSVQSVLFFALLHILHVVSPFASDSLLCCSFPLSNVVVLFAARYKTAEAESASMLLVSTLLLVLTVPAMLWLGK
ncbi:MAG: AEC family transporter [Bryobacteraceae bacterium]|jgi:malonate transporter